MKTTRVPFFKDLGPLGYVEGSSIVQDGSANVLCRYFGGVPYALPAIGPYRWRQARPLPTCFRYGNRANPGRYAGKTATCPQKPPLGDVDESVVDEDCLQTNIWVPASQPPEGGWPVYFFIHGGSLQYGSPECDYADLLGCTSFNAIIVAPAYRLNMFGFLASKELLEEAESNGESLGNFGFWDQRLAMEWTRQNIQHWGGNPENFTLAGYSAGAHSVFYQLSYELGLPMSKSMVNRAVMHSNSCGMQPKFLDEAQLQFDELLSQLGIPLHLSGAEKIRRLRATSPRDLVAANMRMDMHEFRSVSDGTFVRKSLFRELHDGSFARRMRERSIQLMIGECRDEHFVYRHLRPPKTDSYQGLRTRLLGEFPRVGVDSLLQLYYPNGQLPLSRSNWISDAYGHLYADIQVHMLERGLVSCLVDGGAGDLVLRYRVEWRAKETDAKTPRDWQVTHGTDNSIWQYGEGRGLTPDEAKAVKAAFLDLYADFVAGKDIRSNWGAEAPLKVRTMKPDGTVDIWGDTMWDTGMQVWSAVKGVGLGGNGETS